MDAVRRALVVVATVPLMLVAACGSDSPSPDSDTAATAPVTIVGQKFTEADLMTQLYKLLLEKDGFRTKVEELGARENYLGPLQKGGVQVSADYLSSLTEALNRKQNGDAAAPVASPDVTDTLAQLATLGVEYGITPLRPARAEGGKGYAVTRAFAERFHLTTLSDLGRLGRPIALAAETDCSERPDCGQGLKSVYRIALSRIEPLGLGSGDTVSALTSGEVQLAQVGTTDGTLDSLGVVVLQDDRNWQNAENVVPVVNSAWLEDNPRAEAALDKLSAVLTTADLKTLNAKVDGERLEASQVAEDYLNEKGLL
jgi:osmoprotectant transport system substrate-binding protein